MIAQQTEATVQSAAEESLKLWGNLSLGDPWFLALLPVFLIVFLMSWGVAGATGQSWSGGSGGRGVSRGGL